MKFSMLILKLIYNKYMRVSEKFIMVKILKYQIGEEDQWPRRKV